MCKKEKVSKNWAELWGQIRLALDSCSFPTLPRPCVLAREDSTYIRSRTNAGRREEVAAAAATKKKKRHSHAGDDDESEEKFSDNRKLFFSVVLTSLPPYRLSVPPGRNALRFSSVE